MENRLGELRGAGLYRRLASESRVSFAHNDYLGLSQNEEIREAGVRALREHGAGSRGSRLLGGNLKIFTDTEQKIAAFFSAPAASLFSTGYMANIAAVTALADCAKNIVSDEKIHASLIDGIRLSGKPKHVVRHQAWSEVPREICNEDTLLVAESLYSMDGDFVDADALMQLQKETGAFLLVDEAHAAGIVGERGRGFFEDKWDWDRVAVVMTFGKAFGSAGAAVIGSTLLQEWIVNRARTFIYTTAMSPVVAGMINCSLDIVDRSTDLRHELWSRIEKVRTIFGPRILGESSVGFSRSPILPVPVLGEDRALRFAQNMRESGVDLRAIRYPTVARGEERIRVSLNLAVSWNETERMAREVVKQWTEFLSQE